jgi:hypothetical protein
MPLSRIRHSTAAETTKRGAGCRVLNEHCFALLTDLAVKQPLLRSYSIVPNRAPSNQKQALRVMQAAVAGGYRLSRRRVLVTNGYEMEDWLNDTGRIGQDFVLSRTASGGGGCSMGMDLREKGFYCSCSPYAQVF